MNNRVYKPEVIRVRLSSPFLARTKCKYCGGAPSIYFYVKNATLWVNPRKMVELFDVIRPYIRRMGADHYLWDDPKYFTSISTFEFPLTLNKYRPRIHRTRGAKSTADVVEFLTCDCARSNWAFSDKAVENRREINQRKARYRFPHKFEY